MDKDTIDRGLNNRLTWRHRGVKLRATENRRAHYCDFLGLAISSYILFFWHLFVIIVVWQINKTNKTKQTF